MTKFTTALCILGLAILQGCAPTQKLTAEELNAKRTATLNVYDDNRVVLKVMDEGGRGRRASVKWSWTTNKDTVLALYLGNSLYNVKDISRITSQNNKNDGQNLVFYFKNGEKKSAVAGTRWIQGKGMEYFGPMWAACTAHKVCSSWYQINESNYRNSFGNILTAIDDGNLSASSYQRDPKHELMADYRAIPLSTDFQELVVLDDASRSDFDKRLNEMSGRWAAQAPVLAAKRAEAESSAKAKEMDAREKAIKAGQVNCTSTTYSCRSQSYVDQTSLQCGNFTSTVGEMRNNGWVIANVNPEFVRATLGVMCDHNVYHFYYKR